MCVPLEPSLPLSFLPSNLVQITSFKSLSLEKKEYGFFGRRIQGNVPSELEFILLILVVGVGGDDEGGDGGVEGGMKSVSQ